MVRINITHEEYEALILMMGMHAGSIMKDDPELARKVISLYISIVGKKEEFITAEESKKLKTQSPNEKAGFKFPPKKSKKENQVDQTKH